MRRNTIERNQCKYYQFCNAPLCPFDKESLEFGIWYPDEKVCHKRTSIKWIQRQKVLVKRNSNPDLYFDFGMLNNSRIKIGLNPDKVVKKEQEMDKKIKATVPETD